MVEAVGAIVLTLGCLYLSAKVVVMFLLPFVFDLYRPDLNDILYLAFWSLVAVIAVCLWWAVIGSQITIGFG